MALSLLPVQTCVRNSIYGQSTDGLGATGLRAMRDLNWVHRDLKPGEFRGEGYEFRNESGERSTDVEGFHSLPLRAFIIQREKQSVRRRRLTRSNCF